MIELGVNIDHVATVRQARRTYEPDPVWAAVEAHLGGADGITVHLREDRRHIQDEDVRRLRELTHIKLNLEMAATDEMVGIACRIKPEMAMLVPGGPPRGHDRGRARHRRAGRQACKASSRGWPMRASSSRVHRRRRRAGRGGEAHRRLGLRDPHRARTRTRSTPRARCGKPRRRRRARQDRRGGRGDPRARHALQRGPRAQLLQRPAGGATARRARAAHRPRASCAARCSSACARRCAR